MILSIARRFRRLRRHYAASVLAFCGALSFQSLVGLHITANAQATDQVWTDPDTKLMWAAKDNGGYVPPSYGLLSQKEAADYCQNSRLAEYHDWRLPTIEELEQISVKTGEDYHVKGGVIKLSGDQSGENHYVYAQVMVWSQTERADQDAIWEFHFGKYGGRSTTVGGMGVARALCVRGGVAPVGPAGMDAQGGSAHTTTIPRGPSQLNLALEIAGGLIALAFLAVFVFRKGKDDASLSVAPEGSGKRQVAGGKALLLLGIGMGVVAVVTYFFVTHSITSSPAKQAEAAALDMSKYVSADGITIPSGASDAARGSGVYFTTKEGFELSIALQGNPAIATLNYTGTMEAARDGKLAGGTEDFKPTRIETSRNPDKWLAIASFTIGGDGYLVVTDESGASYKIKVAPVSMTGTIEELKPATR